MTSGIKIKFNFHVPDSYLQRGVNASSVSNPALSSTSIASSLASLSSSSSHLAKKSCCQLIRHYLSECISAIHFFFHSLFYATINSSASVKELNKIYNGLGTEKWKECVDGKYHHLGKDVFKLGLHQGCIEPEYVPSMEKAFKFCEKYLNRKVDADWYLQLHRITCGHFDGDPAVYLMGQEKVGVFRDTDDDILWWPSGNYAVTPEAKAELQALDAEVKQELGPEYGMGIMAPDPKWNNAIYHQYHKMTRPQMKRVFNKLMNEFYKEAGSAANRDQTFAAIAKLYKRLELLHPPRDGSGRTNTALVNKILTEYGFSPAILDNPYVSTTYGLARWTQYLKEGVEKWQVQRARLSP